MKGTKRIVMSMMMLCLILEDTPERDYAKSHSDLDLEVKNDKC